MHTSLCIGIVSKINLESQEIDFFEAEEWTTETENLLLKNVHDILSLIRPMGKTLKLQINAGVTDARSAVCMIRKKLNNNCQKNKYKLSTREIEILGLIMQGYKNSEIAEKLFISFQTVKTHRRNILEKTGCKNTVSMINCFHQNFFEQ